jgi:hypothetical protein
MSWEGVRRASMVAIGLGGLVAVGVILLDSGGMFVPVQGVDPAAALRDRVTVLRHRAVMARQGRELLLLDPGNATLTLYLGAAALKAWRVQGVEAGARRFALSPPDEGWRTRLWQNPHLNPPVQRERRLIVSDSVVPPDPAGEVDWIPPTPEEAVPTPSRFVVHYAGGLGLEVVAEGADSLVAKGTMVEEAVAALREFHPDNLDRYRIRVRMAAEDAGALYRSFPDQAALVALWPGPTP